MVGDVIMEGRELLAIFMNDILDDQILVNYSYDYGILMAMTKMFNEDIRYIYNYYFNNGELVKDYIMVNLKVLSKVS
jgi:hypothetical protein